MNLADDNIMQHGVRPAMEPCVLKRTLPEYVMCTLKPHGLTSATEPLVRSIGFQCVLAILDSRDVWRCGAARRWRLVTL